VARLGGLGKGLNALIPTAEGSEAATGDGPRLDEIPIDLIDKNPNQPRVHFDEESLADLAASVSEIGVLQPILVRPVGGRYELVAGERRWRAAKRAGLPVIPAIIRTTDELGSVERALVENLHRSDLTPLEEASAYQQLIDDFSMTHEQVAARVGKSRSAVSNMLRLLTLPPAIQGFLADGRLSAGHARALLGTPDRAFQEQLARRAATGGWSVRAVEDAVRDRQAGGTGVAPDDGETPTPAPGPGSAGRRSGASSSSGRPAGLLELEDLLGEYLSTNVRVSMGARRGKVTIDFADLEDLERLYHLMSGPNRPDSTTESGY
jgi:ParB family chromosome partitioning protein